MEGILSRAREADNRVYLARPVSRAHARPPKSIPTPEVTAMASALQNTTRATPGAIGALPALAATAPRIARSASAVPATHGTGCEACASQATTSGRTPPAAKLAAEAAAACIGRA